MSYWVKVTDDLTELRYGPYSSPQVAAKRKASLDKAFPSALITVEHK